MIDRFEEERRFFYVAVTRAETAFHFVTQEGAVSGYIDSIPSLVVTDDKVEIVEGKLISIQFSDDSKSHKITMDCGSYDAHLLT